MRSHVQTVTTPMPLTSGSLRAQNGHVATWELFLEMEMAYFAVTRVLTKTKPQDF